MTRCGYEWVGHPGMDNGELLTLHGRAANIPASKVTLQIDEKPPYAIRLKGELKEQAFKKVDFSVQTELVTEPGSTSFSLNDTLTNNGDYPKEYQALYHSNFSTPFLEQGRVSKRRSSRSRRSMKKPRVTWATGRPTAHRRRITTRRSTTSCPTAMPRVTR